MLAGESFVLETDCLQQSRNKLIDQNLELHSLHFLCSLEIFRKA